MSAFAQYKISGVVRDFTTKETLPGVTVYISDIKRGAVTGVDGNFEIPNLRKGSYLLEITYTGYQSMPVRVDLEKDTSLMVSLKTSVTELGEVVVTGVTRATELKRNPVIITTISSKELRQSASTNLIDALKEVPGISQITTGPDISKPVIRGLGYNRVITLNNGIRQEGQQWGDEHGIEIDQYSIDRAEIIKGPGSLLYGSDGIAGVLNFLPPKTCSLGSWKCNWISGSNSFPTFSPPAKFLEVLTCMACPVLKKVGVSVLYCAESLFNGLALTIFASARSTGD